VPASPFLGQGCGSGRTRSGGAKEAANGGEVRLGGGVRTIRQYLQAGLIDDRLLLRSDIRDLPSSDIRPALDAADDRRDARHKCAQDRDNDTHSNLFWIQSLALPSQKYGQREAPKGGDFGIKFPAHIRTCDVMAEKVTQQAAK